MPYPELKEVHLGDGLYAGYDGWQIVLRTPREGGDHWVALEPSTFEEFIRFVRGIWPDANKQCAGNFDPVNICEDPEGCDRAARVRGLCDKHWQRVRRREKLSAKTRGGGG